MILTFNPRRQRTMRRTWAGMWVGLAVWACCSPIIHTPTEGFFMSDSRDGGQENSDVLGALNRIAQTLDSHERHTTLYERVAMLEENLSKKTENEAKLESEVLELREKIPLLEAEIQTIPEMRKDLAEFEAKIEKLVHDYEAKLSTLASEVIRLKKNGARRKDLQTLSDGSDNVLLRVDVPTCPEVGLGLVPERVGDQCLYFSWGTALNWTDAHRHCQSLGGDLSAPEDLLPLKTFLHRSFARGPSIWLGASYNLDDNVNVTTTTTDTTGIKAQSLSDPTEENSEGSFSFSLNILGSSDVTNNRIDGDGNEDDPRGIILSDGIALRDEPIAADDGELLGDLSSLSQRFIDRESLFGSLSKRDLKARLQDSSSLTPVVDFILLKDPVRSAEEAEDSSAEGSSRIVSNVPPSSDGVPLVESRSGDHSTLLADISRAKKPSDGLSTTGISRDIREVLDKSSGQDPLASVQLEEETKIAGKTKMNCMLLQQKESLEYELVGQPCNERHRFVCEILSTKNTDRKFTPGNMLHE